MVVSLMGLAAGQAFAGVGASAAPSFPTTVTVGQTNVAAVVRLTNQNTAPDLAATNTVCNAGDPLPCPADDPGITLIPSCGTLTSFSACAPGAAEPGVFDVHMSASGVVGTACEGIDFDLKLLDPGTGRLTLIPDNGQHIQLVGAGAVCEIALVFDVLKTPTIDHDPTLPGVQTVQIVDNTQTTGSLTASARGTSTGTTVAKATPAIATVASPATLIGGALSDTATVTGRVNQVEGATVTFNLYAATDPTCAATPVFTSTVPLAANGTATSSAFTPAAAGSYHWIATYNGDANNNAVSGTCGDTGETGTITQARPSIATLASPSVVRGNPITDTATVSGRVSPVAGATVTFNLYGDGDLGCIAAPVFTSTVPLAADGTATSDSYTPSTAGTYRWIATYNGDVNNAAVSGACGEANETVTATPVNPPGSESPLPRVGSASRREAALGGLMMVGGWMLLLPARRRNRQR